MKKYCTHFFLFVALLLVGGCAGATALVPTLRLQSDNTELQQAAVKSLHRNGLSVNNDDTALPLLTLSEQHDSGVESLTADGSISGYEIDYTLSYQLGNDAVQTIHYEQIVAHNENRYRAGIIQRREMINSLRRDALAQMIIALQLHTLQ